MRALGLALACALTASCSATDIMQIGLASVQEAGAKQQVEASEAPEADAAEPTALAVLSSDPQAEGVAHENGETATAETDETGAQPAAAAESAAELAGNTDVAAADEAVQQAQAAEEPQERRSLLSAFFAPATAGPESNPTRAAIQDTAEAPAPPAEEAEPVTRVAFSGDALPGVRGSEELFEVIRGSGSGSGDISDIDLYEEEPSYRTAYAPGLARLAPNGLLKQHEKVDVSCFRPALMQKLKTIERHYGKPILVTSGYRSPEHNRRVRGAANSFHMKCAAADIQVKGVSKWELARFVRSLPGRGGVGTYCHMNSIHVDVGPKRDWNWRCARR